MASWKKVIVSGSTPELANLKIDGLASGEVVIGAGSGSVLTTTAVNGSGNIVATTAATGLSHSGSFSGSFEGDGSALTGVVATNLDIDTFGSDLTAATLATTDKMILSDGGTEGRVTVGQLATPLAGTGLEANSSTIRIATAAAGNGITGGGGSALAVQADGGTLTVGAGGVKISDGGVTATQIATSVAGDGLAGGGGTALSVNVDDSSIEINTDTLRVKASGITNDMLAGSIANAKLANSSVTVGTTEIALGASSTTLAGLTDVVGTKFSGSFSGSFEGDGSLITGIATTLNLSGDSGTDGVNLKTDTLAVVGTTGEINTAVTNNQIQIGLPDNVTVGGNLTVNGNTVIDGDLTVGGRMVSASSLEVADQFIVMASGSTSAIDGGIIVNQTAAANGQGAGLGYDASADRWVLQSDIAGNATTITADAYVGIIEQAAANPSSNPVYGGTNGLGTLHVNSSTGDVYIYS